MWSGGTSLPLLIKNHSQLLEDLSGSQKKKYSDTFWQELLTFSAPLTKFSPTELEAAVLPFCEKIVQNNACTSNFQTLLEHSLQRIQENGDAVSAQQATNVTVFVRLFLKYLTESLNADDLVAFLDAPIRSARAQGDPGREGDSWVDRLSHATVELLITTRIGADTYLLHLETMNLLLVLLSTQLYSPSAGTEPGAHPFTEVLMDGEDSAAHLLRVLLRHYAERRSLPSQAPVYVPEATERRGVLRIVRSAAASVLWLPIQAITFLVRSGNQQLAESPLCETGLLLLLALVHHAPVEGHRNPYQKALEKLQDKDGLDNSGTEANGPSFSGRSHSIPFSELYAALGKNMSNQRSVLLFYDLLHASQNFRNYVVLHKETEIILLPMLQMLYQSSGGAPSQMYMLLIVILMLSQDPSLSQNVHYITLQSTPWYTERLLKDTSLGSLLVVLLLRTAHYNLSKLKDVYLHTNTLAALANLAPHMSDLSSHAAQRLISLFDMLSRRRLLDLDGEATLTSHMEVGRESITMNGSGCVVIIQTSGQRKSSSLPDQYPKSWYLRLGKRAQEGRSPAGEEQEVQVYHDFLRIVLEIINCIITQGLRKNPELVYALLHRQDVFTPFQDNQQFSDLLQNVHLVISVFNYQVDQARGESRPEWNVSQVLGLIKKNLEDWPGHNQLRHVPELRFSYEEEASPEGFFVPYVWTLVFSHTTIPWRPQAIALFSPFSSEEGGGPTLDNLGNDQEMPLTHHGATDGSNIV